MTGKRPKISRNPLLKHEFLMPGKSEYKNRTCEEMLFTCRRRLNFAWRIDENNRLSSAAQFLLYDDPGAYHSEIDENEGEGQVVGLLSPFANMMSKVCGRDFRCHLGTTTGRRKRSYMRLYINCPGLSITRSWKSTVSRREGLLTRCVYYPRTRSIVEV